MFELLTLNVNYVFPELTPLKEETKNLACLNFVQIEQANLNFGLSFQLKTMHAGHTKAVRYPNVFESTGTRMQVIIILIFFFSPLLLFSTQSGKSWE